jgi:hypothetical protein
LKRLKKALLMPWVNGATYTQKVQALNTLIRGDTSKYDRLADLGADARLQNALDTTYFNADAIHLNAAGQSVAAGIVAAQIATL